MGQKRGFVSRVEAEMLARASIAKSVSFARLSRMLHQGGGVAWDAEGSTTPIV